MKKKIASVGMSTGFLNKPRPSHVLFCDRWLGMQLGGRLLHSPLDFSSRHC
jgi:hypothetical protein